MKSSGVTGHWGHPFAVSVNRESRNPAAIPASLPFAIGDHWFRRTHWVSERPQRARSGRSAFLRRGSYVAIAIPPEILCEDSRLCLLRDGLTHRGELERYPNFA